MPAQQPTPDALTQRRSERRHIAVQVQYKRKLVRLVAKTLDLSVHGLRFSGMERLREGEVVWITLPGLEPRHATVVWSDQFEAGCAFVEPLHPAVFEAVISGHIQ
ncbi:PilZ domain-containing protein [Novosphingobium sp. Chol11]|uniref:PilZ domain-containing protein n=1 Tax=Novosphingobium sp. Chol11 TaxID=1385763 RepID=UPI0025D31DEB|nr:PilZ domain-containing protein [Novosphingobium sp. Chol11]